MTRSKVMRGVGGILVGAGLALTACSDAATEGFADEPLGQARVFIEQAPDDVRCVRITAAGSVIATREFDVTAGESSVFSLNALPLGPVTFSGEATPSECAAESGAAHWVAGPVTVTLEPGVTADVALTMHRNGQALVAVDFAEEQGQGGQPGSAGSAPARALLLSEYVEGSSTYKALEITALSDSSFDGCQLAVYFNGATSASAVALSGALAAGESHVLCSSGLASLMASCDQTASLTFNGDDAIVLECDGATVDALGQVGFDPGTAWGVGELSLLDHTLRRGCEVTEGDANPTDAFDPAVEWLGLPIDTFDDLGQHVCP